MGRIRYFNYDSKLKELAESEPGAGGEAKDNVWSVPFRGEQLDRIFQGEDLAGLRLVKENIEYLGLSGNALLRAGSLVYQAFEAWTGNKLYSIR